MSGGSRFGAGRQLNAAGCPVGGILVGLHGACTADVIALWICVRVADGRGHGFTPAQVALMLP